MWSRGFVGVGLLCILRCRSSYALSAVEANIQDSANEIKDTDPSSVPQKLGVWASKCEYSSCVTYCESIGYIFGNCNGNYCICTYPREKNGLDEPTKLDRCNPIQCDQNCRRIGFNGGACVGNKCKCDILQAENLESIPTVSVTTCDWSSCNAYCQTVGFISGYCLYDNCMCVYPKPTKKKKHTRDSTHELKDTDLSSAPQKLGVWATKCEYSSCVTYCESIGYIFGNCNGNYCICTYPRGKNGLDEPMKLNGCNPIQCDQNCRRIGFNGGACVGNKCKCDMLQVENLESIPTATVTTCDWSSCNAYCQTVGFITGYCLCDNCMCVYPKPTKKRKHTRDSTRALNTVRASVRLGTCNERTCSTLCHHMGYDQQQCFGDTCDCTHSQTGNDKIEETGTSCNVQQCDQLCRRLGFTGGICIGNKCKCDIMMEIEAMIEPTHRRRKGSCNPRQCDQNCRKIGFKGGACVNGRCKCDILKETEKSSDHHLERREASECEYYKCYNLCRRVNYDSGVCVGDRCKCDVLLPMEDALIPTDIGGSCTTIDCGDFCKSIAMSGGTCVDTKCRCEILLQKEDNDIPPLYEEDAINLRNL